MRKLLLLPGRPNGRMVVKLSWYRRPFERWIRTATWPEVHAELKRAGHLHGPLSKMHRD